MQAPGAKFALIVLGEGGAVASGGECDGEAGFGLLVAVDEADLADVCGIINKFYEFALVCMCRIAT